MGRRERSSALAMRVEAAVVLRIRPVPVQCRAKWSPSLPGGWRLGAAPTCHVLRCDPEPALEWSKSPERVDILFQSSLVTVSRSASALHSTAERDPYLPSQVLRRRAASRCEPRAAELSATKTPGRRPLREKPLRHAMRSQHPPEPGRWSDGRLRACRLAINPHEPQAAGQLHCHQPSVCERFLSWSIPLSNRTACGGAVSNRFGFEIALPALRNDPTSAAYGMPSKEKCS